MLFPNRTGPIFGAKMCHSACSLSGLSPVVPYTVRPSQAVYSQHGALCWLWSKNRYFSWSVSIEHSEDFSIKKTTILARFCLSFVNINKWSFFHRTQSILLFTDTILSHIFTFHAFIIVFNDFAVVNVAVTVAVDVEFVSLQCHREAFHKERYFESFSFPIFRCDDSAIVIRIIRLFFICCWFCCASYFVKMRNERFLKTRRPDQQALFDSLFHFFHFLRVLYKDLFDAVYVFLVFVSEITFYWLGSLIRLPWGKTKVVLLFFFLFIYCQNIHNERKEKKMNNLLLCDCA